MPLWLAKLAIPRWAWLALFLAVVLGLCLAMSQCEKADDRQNREIGATGQREANLQATVKNAEKANEAVQTVRSDPDAARAECLRNARNPGNC